MRAEISMNCSATPHRPLFAIQSGRRKKGPKMDHSIAKKLHNSQQPTKSAQSRSIPKEEVQFRAYQIYVSRNRQPGRELDDWLRAERELQIESLTRN